MNNILSIIQPGRIGDIIIVLPAAKHYHDQGYQIVWPVCSQYLPLFGYVFDYVQAIDIGSEIQGSRQRALNNFIMRTNNILDLAIGFGRDESDWRKGPLSFDEWKYKEAGLPIEEKYKLAIKRNPKKEERLMHVMGLDGHEGEYIITHSDHASCNLHYTWNLPGHIVEIRPIDGFTVFDWLGIFESAKEIYCVDSCIANMINQLGIGIGKRYFRSWRQDFENKPDWDQKGITDPHLAGDWKFIGKKD